jgi:DNA (cytosine-5)-methyltransferase 1
VRDHEPNSRQGSGGLRWNGDLRPAPAIMAFGVWAMRPNQVWIEVDDVTTITTNKPEYRVPSMAEIAAIEPNGYMIVSTFSGCGGSCLGFKMAGFKVAWASEFVPAAAEVYRLNHPGTVLDTKDIRQVKGVDILPVAGQIDVLEGSPPCAAFSTAGKRNKTWGKQRHYSDRVQQTDDLFDEFARLVRELQPRVFIAENVSGLVKGIAKGYFLAILAELKSAGYVVEAKLLDASWLGVPQSRQRIIFQGLRRDLAERTGLRPRWPKPLPYQYTIRDALPWLSNGHTEWRRGSQFEWYNQPLDKPALTIDTNAVNTRLVADGHGWYPGTDIDVANSPAPTVPATPNGAGYYRHQLVNTQRIQQKDVVDEDTAASLDGYAIGTEWDKLKPGESSDKYLNLSRPHPDAPSPSITAQGAGGSGGIGVPGSTASVTHPYERRKFTIAELKRLCAFPDDFILTGTYAQQWERLGRAVPPVMMRAVAIEVRELLKNVDAACAES